jgi:hypothetical protein
MSSCIAKPIKMDNRIRFASGFLGGITLAEIASGTYKNKRQRDIIRTVIITAFY